jgi:dihydroorotate dehydrogenase electron transfer subunit
MIKVSPHYDPLLRRPMSFHRIIPPHPPFKKGGRGEFEILYQITGKGTEIMSNLKEGDKIDILGPLGRGFWFPEGIEKAIIIAGGIGVAPMVALAEEIFKIQNPKSKISISVFIGGKTKDDILCKGDFEKIGANVHIATEDGSMGKKETCVDLLREFVINHQSSIVNRQSSIIFACGPNGMLKAIADISINKNISCQVSLDKNMACGTGACLGCVVKVKGQGVMGQPPESPLTKGDRGSCYKCVCKDGPVFDAGEILWEEI